MAIKFPGSSLFTGADAKSRIFLVLAAIAVISLAGFLIVHYVGGGPSATGPSKVATPPASLQTVPGGQMTPEFYRAVVQANAQAAQQAQISGGSAVPTLINVPGGQGFPEQNCTIVCPSEEKANVADDISNLVKQNKLSQEDANRLLDLAKNNVSVDEYAAALDDLVRQGKLTPEQARALLDKYKKQKANGLINESGALMDSLIKAGQLPLDTATELLNMQKNGISPENYGAQLNRLVREGKLSPAVANQLLG
ncbi:MAG TPA: hypothetical protein VHA52_08820, partial [Candidatus Babeliaceae bacterium]|nr:hypothetical protein [Candidatus Babeliaceae bacterium]